jgi:hypothetical protein
VRTWRSWDVGAAATWAAHPPTRAPSCVRRHSYEHASGLALTRCGLRCCVWDVICVSADWLADSVHSGHFEVCATLCIMSVDKYVARTSADAGSGGARARRHACCGHRAGMAGAASHAARTWLASPVQQQGWRLHRRCCCYCLVGSNDDVDTCCRIHSVLPLSTLMLRCSHVQL